MAAKSMGTVSYHKDATEAAERQRWGLRNGRLMGSHKAQITKERNHETALSGQQSDKKLFESRGSFVSVLL